MKFRVKDPSATLEIDTVGVTVDYLNGNVQCQTLGQYVIEVAETRAVSIYFGDPSDSGPLVTRNPLNEIHEGTATAVEVQIDHISPMLYAVMASDPTSPEGTDQMNQIQELRSELYVASAALERIEERLKLAEADAYPKEPYANGSIVRFSRTPFGNHGSYDYAAIKAGGRWYTTGATCPAKGRTWKGLIDWIREGGQWSPLQVMVATGGDKLRVVKL